MELKYKRILLKMSGEVLGDSNAAVSEENAKQAAKRIKLLKDAGAEVAVVVGGGNIMRGRSSHCIDRNRADHMGMLATAINSLAIQDALLGMGVDCTVLSAVEMQRFCDTYSSRQAKAELDGGKVVLFACGTGSPFFSTDTAAALRALEIHADALVLAKSVDVTEVNSDVIISVAVIPLQKTNRSLVTLKFNEWNSELNGYEQKTEHYLLKNA